MQYLLHYCIPGVCGGRARPVARELTRLITARCMSMNLAANWKRVLMATGIRVDDFVKLVTGWVDGA